MIAWLGDLAAPVFAAVLGLAVLALLAAHRWDRPRVWMLPTLPTRPLAPPDVVADRVIAQLLDTGAAAHTERGLEIRTWAQVGHGWAVEANGLYVPCASTDEVHQLVTEAVWAARTRLP